MWINQMLGPSIKAFFDAVGNFIGGLSPGWMDSLYEQYIAHYVGSIPWSGIFSTIVIGGLTLGFLDDVASGRG